MRDEVLLGGIVSALFVSDLRARVRRYMSCSDASEEGGCAAEASSSGHHLKASPISAGLNRRVLAERYMQTSSG